MVGSCSSGCRGETSASEAAQSVENRPAESGFSRLGGSKLFCWPQKAKPWCQKRRKLSRRNPLSLVRSGLMGAGLFTGRTGPRASESNVIGAVFEYIRLTSRAKSWSQRRRCWQARPKFRLNGWKLFFWLQRRNFGVRSGGIG